MNSNERNCDKCVYGRRSGNCTAWNCKGTVTVEDIKTEARKETVMCVRKLIKIFWQDWNKTSHKKLSYLAFEELDEHILEQSDESNGREFMQFYKENNNGKTRFNG